MGKDGEVVFRYLVGCCLDNTSISDYCRDHKAVCSSTVLKLGRVPVEEMAGNCNRLIRETMRMALRSGRYRNCDTSLDYHDMPYHGRRKEHTIKVLVNGKYRRCYRFAVSSLTARDRFLATGIQLYKEGDGNLLMVDRLLDTVPGGHDLVLMDRYFCGVDVFNRVEEKGMHYLTPYKTNNRIDELYLESLLDGETVKPYKMRKKGAEKKKVNIHLVAYPEEEYRAYVSDLTDRGIEERYTYRWNIENLFKVMKWLKPVTSTTRESFRLLLTTIALILASLWKLLVITKQHVTVKRFKKQLETILQQTPEYHDIMITTTTKT
ncbi:transposase [Methanooceanicella nereidis]|nr:transposase [Methanocella sp. CWC-04]